MLQRKTRRRYSASPKQLERRRVLNYTNAEWQNTTPEVRAMWEQFAVTIKQYDSLGQRVTLTGLQAWTALNLSLVGAVTPFNTDITLLVLNDGYLDVQARFVNCFIARDTYNFNFLFNGIFLVLFYVSQPIKDTVNDYKGAFNFEGFDIGFSEARPSLVFDIPEGHYRLFKFVFLTSTSNLGVTKIFRIPRCV